MTSSTLWPQAPATAEAAESDMAMARVEYWKLYPNQFWKVCPDLRGVLSSNSKHAALMDQAADALAMSGIGHDLRDCRALRIYAAQVRATVKAEAA